MNEIGVSEDAEGDGSVSAIGRSGSVGDDNINIISWGGDQV